MAVNKDKPMDLYDQQEKSETSFDDLPDDIHIQIMEKLDLASSFQLRVNRRLDRIQLSVKKELKCISVHISATGYYEIMVHKSNMLFGVDFESLEKGLHRLAMNTRVYRISMAIEVMPKEEHGRIVSAIAQFEAEHCDFNRNRGKWNLPQITLPFLLTIAQNVCQFNSNFVCGSLTAQDLCIIRKAMLEGSCKLRTFSVLVREGMEKSFLDACFGVTIDDFPGPLRGRIYSATDDSVELYSISPPLNKPYDMLSHFENNIKTTIMFLSGRKYGVHIQKLEKSTRDREAWSAQKIQMNHFYIRH